MFGTKLSKAKANYWKKIREKGREEEGKEMEH
jgi:hypothetical protein